jgi:hypothetical protein
MLLSNRARSPAIRVDRVGLVRVEDRGKLTAYALVEVLRVLDERIPSVPAVWQVWGRSADRPQPMLTEWTPS